MFWAPTLVSKTLVLNFSFQCSVGRETGDGLGYTGLKQSCWPTSCSEQGQWNITGGFPCYIQLSSEHPQWWRSYSVFGQGTLLREKERLWEVCHQGCSVQARFSKKNLCFFLFKHQYCCLYPNVEPYTLCKNTVGISGKKKETPQSLHSGLTLPVYSL